MSVHVAMRSIAFPGALKFSKLEKYSKILRWIYCYRKRLHRGKPRTFRLKQIDFD